MLMHPSSEVWETHRLTALLDEQHADLAETAAGLRERRGSARLDLFLRFRRLAVLHTLLQELVVRPLLGPGAPAPDDLVSPLLSELEGHPTGGRASDWGRVLAQVDLHTRECQAGDPSVVPHRLTAQQTRVAARICHLWTHEAEVLGSTAAEMSWILRDHLAHPEVAEQIDAAADRALGSCMGSGGTGTSLLAGPVQWGEAW